MASTDLAISVRGLSKAYTIAHDAPKHTTLAEAMIHRLRRPLERQTKETFWALRDLSLDVRKGEVMGIIGRNGAGKSTFLKVLSRITEPTSGKIDLYGRIGSLLEVGTGFHPELTGRENIHLNGQILGMRKREIERQFDAIVDFAGVEQFLDTPVKRYSSGMYVRLAFAVAAHLDPEILVIDEVLAVGDAEFQKKCIGKMRDVSSQGRTVLFVSHNMSAVEQLCSSVVVLQNGKLLTQSTDVREAIAKYLFDGGVQRTEWTNSGSEYGNPYFQPLRFYLSDEDGAALTTNQRNDADLWVCIEALVETLDPSLTIGYALFSEGGECLYWSYQTDAHPDDWPKLRVGKNLLRSKIPQGLLNRGNYRIELIGGLSFREWLFQPGVNCPSVILSVEGALSPSPLYLHARPTLLAPVLPWESNVLLGAGTFPRPAFAGAERSA